MSQKVQDRLVNLVRASYVTYVILVKEKLMLQPFRHIALRLSEITDLTFDTVQKLE